MALPLFPSCENAFGPKPGSTFVHGELVERVISDPGIVLDEIVFRQAEASEAGVALTKKLAALAGEREKLLLAYYANAIPLELLKADQKVRRRFNEAVLESVYIADGKVARAQALTVAFGKRGRGLVERR